MNRRDKMFTFLFFSEFQFEINENYNKNCFSTGEYCLFSYLENTVIFLSIKHFGKALIIIHIDSSEGTEHFSRAIRAPSTTKTLINFHILHD